nr:MAG TPA: hypothetical protein [Caudoviricetes sp.]
MTAAWWTGFYRQRQGTWSFKRPVWPCLPFGHQPPD